MTRRRLDIRDLRVLSLSVVFIFALLVSGCDDDPAEPGDFNSGELAIIPSSATVPAGGVQDPLTVAGDQVDPVGGCNLQHVCRNERPVRLGHFFRNGSSA